MARAVWRFWRARKSAGSEPGAGDDQQLFVVVPEPSVEPLVAEGAPPTPVVSQPPLLVPFPVVMLLESVLPVVVPSLALLDGVLDGVWPVVPLLVPDAAPAPDAPEPADPPDAP